MKYIFALLICCVSFVTKAQKINAVVKDSITNLPVAYAGINNMNTRATILSNTKGLFSITATIGNIISVSAVGYSFDTIRITQEIINNQVLIIYLNPLSRNLPDVIVKSNKYNAYQLDSMERRKDFFSTMSEHTQPVASLANSGAGIGINLNHFYKDERHKRESISFFNEIEKDQYINYRFSPQLVNKYTSLSADSTQIFMQQYRPTFDWLRKHPSEEDMLYYINDKLKLFLK